MNYLLFRHCKTITNESSIKDFHREYSVIEFRFKPWKLYHYIENNSERNFRTSLFRFYISFLTLGKAKVYIVTNSEGIIVHKSYLITPNYKYDFLKNNEAAIGPCNTTKEARGKGIYLNMIKYIVLNNPQYQFLMFIRKENEVSIRGVKKAGFVLSENKVKSVGLLNRFVLDK